MGSKKISLLKRLKKESSSKLKYMFSAFKWKRLTHLPASFIDNVVFKLVSAFEAFVLVLSVSFFYLCCGCNF
ncbi:hypothetical protein RIF29_26512 [Crotalaria pallida]|uniref:Uncharacterized protein n=1 Tax=Crotalaria pallida TaxID=3830 RepID=A0AAN9I1R4_CROPI